MGPPVSEGFVDVGLHLKSQVLTKKITSERVSFQSMRSLSAQEVAEGLKGLLNLRTYRFWKTVSKEQDFEAYQNRRQRQRQRQPADKRSYH